MLLDVDQKRIQAEWYFVPTVEARTAEEKQATTFVCQRGSSRLSTT
jgi:hypothetical protein